MSKLQGSLRELQQKSRLSKLQQKKRSFFLFLGGMVFVGLLSGGLLVDQASAQITYTPTKHSAYQAVDSDGTTAWPSGGGQPYPIEMIGVVINNPWDMLNYSLSASQPQWQVFIQAVGTNLPQLPSELQNDFGGTALYMRKNHPWQSDINYTDAAWLSEMQRLNYPGGVTEPLRRGDLIKVQAKAPGMFFRGKRNVNEMHNIDPAYDFYITILARNVPLEAANITLADLKDANNNFIFDETRQTGCERYQGSLVHLDNLLLVDPQNWVLDGTVTIQQGTRTFPMKLGIDPALAAINAALLATTPFSVTAILDQEDSESPFTDNYRLWLTSASDLGAPFAVVPEPSSWVLLGVGLTVIGMVRRFGRRGLAW